MTAGTLLLSQDPGAWELSWHAPEACPTGVQVRVAVAQMVGPQPAAQLSVDAVVTEIRGQWQLALELAGPQGTGQRALTADNCEALAQAAAVVIAIAIDPEFSGGDPAVVARDESPVEPAAPAQPNIPVAPEPAQPAPSSARPAVDIAVAGDELGEQPTSPDARVRRVGGFVDMGSGVGFGLLPKPAAVLGLQVGVAARRWRVGLGVEGWFPRRTTGPNNPAVGGEFSLIDGQLFGCATPRLGAFVMPLCTGVDIGAVRGRGVGQLTTVNTATTLWAGIRGAAGVMWNWKWLGLWLRGSVSVGLVRPAFHTTQQPEIFRVGSVGGLVTGGVEFRLPSSQ